MLLGVGSIGIKSELEEIAGPFLAASGCAVLFYDPHDQVTLSASPAVRSTPCPVLDEECVTG